MSTAPVLGNVLTAALPDMLVIGPMRTGTTWIYEYLKARDDVCLPVGVKETFFFDRRYQNDINWYAAHFRHFKPKKHLRIIEVAPSYFHNEKVPERILSDLGHLSFIVIIRDPVERSISHYRHLKRRGLVGDDLKEAVRSFPEIVGASRYTEHLQRWEAVFGSDAIRLLSHDKLCSEPQAFTAELCRALNLPFAAVSLELAGTEVNTTGIPPSALLARIGLKTADWFRDRRMYAPIEFAKRLGLKRLFFGSERGSRKVMVSDDERNWLLDILGADQGRYRSALSMRASVPRELG